MQLGAEKLADALIDIGATSTEAEQLIARLVSTPNENLKRFKHRLSAVKRSTRFIDWKEVDAFSNTLYDLLEDLKLGQPSAAEGLELITLFFKTDDEILNRCDDSSGIIGQIYTFDACHLLTDYAKSCDDKDKVAEIVYDLMLDDGFGVRDSVLKHANQYLPKSNIQSLMNRFQHKKETSENEHQQRSFQHYIEMLARQVDDPKLYENIRTSDDRPIDTYDCIDIAKVYLDHGDAKTALSWAKRASEDLYYGKKDLLLRIHSELNNIDDQIKIATELFQEHRSTKTFEQLINVIGDDQRNTILEREVEEILNDKVFSLSNITFLVDQKFFKEAERYTILHASQLDGSYYSSMLPIAKALAKENCWLASTLMYRSLLHSILDRAYSKAYPYGAGYLKKLDVQSSHIPDWKNFIDHTQYKESLRKNHGRKSAFWRRYDD